MIRLAPFVVFAYVVAGLAGAASEAPVVLGRFSYQAAALLVVILVVYVIGIVPPRGTGLDGRPALGREALGLVALVALTFVVPGSNAVQRLPWVQYVLPAVRILAAVALVAREAARTRGGGPLHGPMLAASMVLMVWASADLVVAGVTRHAAPHAQASPLAFREAVDLSRLPPDAVVLIGDSFVWGQGVEAGETLGARLEQALGEQGGAAPVYSLGVVGAGLRTYLDVVSVLPPDRQVGRIALVFYMNDMPSAPRLADSFRNLMITLGVGAPTLRIVGDLAARSLTPTLDAYHATVAADYDETGATFSRRWDTLRGQLSAFAVAARQRSRGTPLLVVLPLMVDFAAYPLDHAHQRLAGLGGELGYDVVDLLPVFREQLGDGRRHLVAPGDNHFDASTHAVVGRTLAAALGGP